jgi:hypothetical protein
MIYFPPTLSFGLHAYSAPYSMPDTQNKKNKMNKTNKQEEALNSEKVHAENHDENCIGKCIKFNLIVVLVTLV